MRYITNSMALLSTLFFACTAHAGAMGESSARFSGFWTGVGGSYNDSTISGKTNITQISSAPSNAEYLLNDNLTTHLAADVNVGYFYDFQNDWLAGLKFAYKYIGQEQYDASWSGTFSDGTYQTAGLRTKFMQDFFLLVDGACQFNSWLLYAGAGPSWVNVREYLNGDVLPASSFIFTPVNQSKSEYITGGVGEVGFQYMLPHRFAVDISYNFVATPSGSLPPIQFATTNSANYTVFNQSVSIVEQGFNITLNKYW